LKSAFSFQRGTFQIELSGKVTHTSQNGCKASNNTVWICCYKEQFTSSITSSTENGPSMDLHNILKCICRVHPHHITTNDRHRSLKYIWEYLTGPLKVRSMSVTLRNVNRTHVKETWKATVEATMASVLTMRKLALSLSLSLWLYSSSGLGCFFSFLMLYTQSVGPLGRRISPSQGSYLHTGNNTNSE
jgi:hypothetical protein